MTINIAAGAAAYAHTAKQLGAASPLGAGQGFGDLLKQSIEGAIDTQKSGEAASLGAMSGKTDINNVVQAVNNAEVTLQTVLAVRDKVLSAYTEIMHMTV